MLLNIHLMLSSIGIVKVIKMSKLNVCLSSLFVFYFLSSYDGPRTKVLTSPITGRQTPTRIPRVTSQGELSHESQVKFKLTGTQQNIDLKYHLLCEKSINQHLTSVGQRKNLSFRQNSNL